MRIVLCVAASLLIFTAVDAQVPAEQAPPRWEVFHRSKVTKEKSGWLEVVAGRLIFMTSLEKGLYTWGLPLRLVRNATVRGDWVVVESDGPRSQQFEPRFRPKQHSASALAAEIRRLAADSSVVAAGDGHAVVRWVLYEDQRILVTAVDGRSVWATEGGPRITTYPGSKTVIIDFNDPHLVRAPAAKEFRWVGADLDLLAGPHVLSIAMLNDREHKLCTIDVDVQPDHTYELKKGDRDIPALKDATSGVSTSGHCAADNREHVASTMTREPGLMLLFDGWSPWVNFGTRRIRNPEASPSGVRWVGPDIGLPAGSHTLSAMVNYVTAYEQQTSAAICSIALVIEPGIRYEGLFKLGKIKGTSLKSARIWIIDDQKRTVGSCGEI